MKVNRFYTPISFQPPKTSITGPKLIPKSKWKITSYQWSHGSTITPAASTFKSTYYKTPEHVRKCTQVARKFLFCAQMLASVSRKCISSDVQVARRCTQVTQPAPNLACVSQVYRRCVAIVSQVCRRCVSTVLQLSQLSQSG